MGGEGSEGSFSGAASHTSPPLWGACWREPAPASVPRVKDKGLANMIPGELSLRPDFHSG